MSLFVMLKGADWLIDNAEKLGLSLGLSPFIVGVFIVGMGTSFPELISSLFATFNGLNDVAVANAVGSNIANILLIVGLSAFFGKRLVVTKDLIDLDLPLLAIVTVFTLGVLWDGQVLFGEAVLMLAGYAVYVLYSAYSTDDSEKLSKKERPKITSKDTVFLILGVIGLIVGAKYLVDSLVHISSGLNIATGVIAITAVAIGTSLPELIVSVKAAKQGKSEVALGNIFGSNVFNSLVVIGIPGLFRTLTVDTQTYSIGLMAMAVATLLFVVSGISKRIHIWEGSFYLLLYVLFIVKLFGWF